MLTWIRKKSTGLFMTIVMILLIAAFALWGVGDYITQSGDDTLATVNGENISYNEYTNQFNNYRQSMMAQFGEGFDPSYFDSPMLKRNYLESMINSELVRQVAVENGYTVTADEIRQTLEQAPAFKDADGQFDKSLYASFLVRTNQSAQLLQMKIADEQAGQALNGVFDQSSFVTPFEAKKMAQLNKQTRDIEFVTITPEKFSDEVNITDEEVEAYYNDNSTQFMTQEMVSVNYIELKAEDVAGSIEIDDEQATKRYNDNKQAYIVPEQRMASHILINASDDAADKIEEIQAKLSAGESFADLAKTNSDDPGSADAGGDLGWVSTGDMVAAFNDTLFEMENGTISDSVETEFGLHLIQLNEIKPERTPEFAEVKADIVQALQAEQAEVKFFDEVSALSEASLDAMSGLEQVAEEAGYELKSTEFFARTGGADLAANPAFSQAAFSENVKENLLNSEAININDSHVVFLHVKETQPAALKPIEEVKESVTASLTTEKINQAAKDLADQMVASIEAGESLAAVAEANDLTLVNNEAVTRTGSSLPFNLVKNVFELARPSGESNAVHVVNGNGAEVVIVNLLTVNDIDLSSIEDLDTESAQLGRNIKSNEQQLLIQALRQSANVTINEELLNQPANL